MTQRLNNVFEVELKSSKDEPAIHRQQNKSFILCWSNASDQHFMNEISKVFELKPPGHQIKTQDHVFYTIISKPKKIYFWSNLYVKPKKVTHHSFWWSPSIYQYMVMVLSSFTFHKIQSYTCIIMNMQYNTNFEGVTYILYWEN